MPINPLRPLPLLPVPGQAPLRPMFRSLGIAASGISAQRQRMETIAQNIANADVTRTANGTPYKRKETVLESASAPTAAFNPGTVPLPGLPALPSDSARTFSVPLSQLPPVQNQVDFAAGNQLGVRVAGVKEVESEGRLVYEPGHPDADQNGYVRYPDIDTTQELVKLLDAKRIYEANAAVFQTTKSMLRAAIDI